jgi:hypothetical protein
MLTGIPIGVVRLMYPPDRDFFKESANANRIGRLFLGPAAVFSILDESTTNACRSKREE